MRHRKHACHGCFILFGSRAKVSTHPLALSTKLSETLQALERPWAVEGDCRRGSSLASTTNFPYRDRLTPRTTATSTSLSSPSRLRSLLGLFASHWCAFVICGISGHIASAVPLKHKHCLVTLHSPQDPANMSQVPAHLLELRTFSAKQPPGHDLSLIHI